MKKAIKYLFLTFLLAAFLTGCGSSAEEEAAEATPQQELYPVTIDGTEVRLGETTVQALLDKGLKLTVSEADENMNITEYEIDPEMELEPNSYYSGGSISLTDNMFAHISLVTDEKAVRMGDAVIAYMEFYFQSEDKSELEKIMFNGVPVTEISREKAGEMFPDFTGDDNMWLQYGPDYDYTLSFDSDKMLVKLSLSKNYDVDWSSGAQ